MPQTKRKRFHRRVKDNETLKTVGKVMDVLSPWDTGHDKRFLSGLLSQYYGIDPRTGEVVNTIGAGFRRGWNKADRERQGLPPEELIMPGLVLDTMSLPDYLTLGNSGLEFSEDAARQSEQISKSVNDSFGLAPPQGLLENIVQSSGIVAGQLPVGGLGLVGKAGKIPKLAEAALEWFSPITDLKLGNVAAGGTFGGTLNAGLQGLSGAASEALAEEQLALAEDEARQLAQQEIFDKWLEGIRRTQFLEQMTKGRGDTPENPTEDLYMPNIFQDPRLAEYLDENPDEFLPWFRDIHRRGYPMNPNPSMEELENPTEPEESEAPAWSVLNLDQDFDPTWLQEQHRQWRAYQNPGSGGLAQYAKGSGVKVGPREFDAVQDALRSGFPKPGVFSVLDNLIEEAPFERGTPEQWTNYLKPGKEHIREGVKFPLRPEELRWTGSQYKGALSEPSRSVSKEELLGALRKGRPKFKSEVHGSQEMSVRDQNRLLEKTESLNGDEILEERTLNNSVSPEGMGILQRTRGEIHPSWGDSRFNYTKVPGGENYHEWLTGFVPNADESLYPYPQRHFPEDTLSWSRVEDLDNVRILGETQSDLHQAATKKWPNPEGVPTERVKYATNPENRKTTEEMAPEWNWRINVLAEDEFKEKFGRSFNERSSQDLDKFYDIEDKYMRKFQMPPGGQPIESPMMGDTWIRHELQKNLLEAAEQGNEGLGVVNPQMAATRYADNPGLGAFYGNEVVPELERLARRYGAEMGNTGSYSEIHGDTIKSFRVSTEQLNDLSTRDNFQVRNDLPFWELRDRAKQALQILKDSGYDLDVLSPSVRGTLEEISAGVSSFNPHDDLRIALGQASQALSATADALEKRRIQKLDHPTLKFTPELREKIKRIGVPLFSTLPGVLNLFAPTEDEEVQTFAKGSDVKAPLSQIAEMMKVLSVNPAASARFKGHPIGDPVEEVLYATQEGVKRGVLKPEEAALIKTQLDTGDENALMESLLKLHEKLYPSDVSLKAAPLQAINPLGKPLPEGSGKLSQDEWERLILKTKKAKGGKIKGYAKGSDVDGKQVKSALLKLREKLAQGLDQTEIPVAGVSKGQELVTTPPSSASPPATPEIGEVIGDRLNALMGKMEAPKPEVGLPNPNVSRRSVLKGIAGALNPIDIPISAEDIMKSALRGGMKNLERPEGFGSETLRQAFIDAEALLDDEWDSGFTPEGMPETRRFLSIHFPNSPSLHQAFKVLETHGLKSLELKPYGDNSPEHNSWHKDQQEIQKAFWDEMDKTAEQYGFKKNPLYAESESWPDRWGKVKNPEEVGPYDHDSYLPQDYEVKARYPTHDEYIQKLEEESQAWFDSKSPKFQELWNKKDEDFADSDELIDEAYDTLPLDEYVDFLQNSAWDRPSAIMDIAARRGIEVDDSEISMYNQSEINPEPLSPYEKRILDEIFPDGVPDRLINKGSWDT